MGNHQHSIEIKDAIARQRCRGSKTSFASKLVSFGLPINSTLEYLTGIRPIPASSIRCRFLWRQVPVSSVTWTITLFQLHALHQMNLSHRGLDELPFAKGSLLRHPRAATSQWLTCGRSGFLLATDRQGQHPTFHLHHKVDLFLHSNIIPTIAPRSIFVHPAWDNGVRQNADTASRCCRQGVS